MQLAEERCIRIGTLKMRLDKEREIVLLKMMNINQPNLLEEYHQKEPDKNKEKSAQPSFSLV